MRTAQPFVRRFSGPDYRNRSGGNQVPPPLAVKNLDRVGCVAQLRRVLRRPVDTDAKPSYRSFSESLSDEFGTVDCLSFGHEVRRNAARIQGELFRQRPERSVGGSPERLVSTHFSVRRDGALFKILCRREQKRRDDPSSCHGTHRLRSYLMSRDPGDFLVPSVTGIADSDCDSHHYVVPSLPGILFAHRRINPLASSRADGVLMTARTERPIRDAPGVANAIE